jgi:hypothetical protein
MTCATRNDVQQVSADVDQPPWRKSKLPPAGMDSRRWRLVAWPGVRRGIFRGLRMRGLNLGWEKIDTTSLGSARRSHFGGHTKGSSAPKFAHAGQRRGLMKRKRVRGANGGSRPKERAASRGNGARKGDRSHIRHVRSFPRRTRHFPCKFRIHRGPETLGAHGAFLTL